MNGIILNNWEIMTDNKKFNYSKKMWEKRIGPMIGIISNIVLLQRAFRKVKILDLWKHERKDWEKPKTLDKYYEFSQLCPSPRDKIPDVN